MLVYKALFRIIKKNLNQILIYVFVFLLMAVLLANTYTNPVEMDFTESKINIAVINEDESTKFVENFKNYLQQYANFIPISENDKALKDALFFREVDYIILIPKDFTKNFFAGENVSIEKTSIPSSASSVFLDRILNKYFNTANIYLNSGISFTEDQLTDYIVKDLSLNTDVRVSSTPLQKNNNDKCSTYFNVLAYSIFTILILGVSAVMLVFNHPDLTRRNNCSPMKLMNRNVQLILGNISFAILTWLVMISASFIMYKGYMVTGKGLLFILNSFLFTLTVLCISFLIGNIIKKKDSMSAISNVVGLGSCFISGVFVPQALLGNTILKLASLTPTYWFVKTNNAITDLADYQFNSLRPLFANMAIMTFFGATFIILTLVIIKQKRVSA